MWYISQRLCCISAVDFFSYKINESDVTLEETGVEIGCSTPGP